MVHVYLNQDIYSPGDELKIAVSLSRTDAIQLLSVRCIGFVRLPTVVARELPEKEKYAFKDKPAGPNFPDDAVLLWLTPNFPIHIDYPQSAHGLVKLHIPYFLPPSIKGGLYEICHYLEVSILNRGDFEMRTKRIPIAITSIDSMPKLLHPAVGDGYEQVDFSLPPVHQSTPHGKRASAWEATDLISKRTTRRTASAIFKSRRGFRISFNNQHATEVVAHGEWQGDTLLVEDGSIIPVHFRFDQPGVMVKRIVTRLVRVERIQNRDDQVHESTIWESYPLAITPHVVETSQSVPIPKHLCSSFQSSLLLLGYRLDFELRAVAAESGVLLEPVHWALPIRVRPSDADSLTSPDPWPSIPMGTITPIFQTEDDDEMESPTGKPQSATQCDIDSVMCNSAQHAGSMKFSIYS